MNISSIQLTLLIGKFAPLPASLELMEALQSIEITQSEVAGFQLTFQAQRGPYISLDYNLLSSFLLQPGNRVVIIVTVSAIPRVIMDGIITHQQFSPGNNGEMLLTVTGEDLSVLMDMVQISMSFPGMGEEAIVLLVLEKYAEFGILPQIIPPPAGVISLPIEHIPQQSETDRNYLKGLAAKHGYIFFIKPGLVPLENIAYWGPVNRFGLPQRALTFNAGPATNIESINFSYDALTPTLVYGEVSDEEVEDDIPVETFASTRVPSLASMSPLIFNQPFVRRTRLGYQGGSSIDAQARAQAITDQSVATAVTANGSLDVLRYGDVLMAPGLVGVRGVGYTYDGNYYVVNVSHQIGKGQYKQSFSLAREGIGSLTPGVEP
jgi:hypothetical protein